MTNFRNYILFLEKVKTGHLMNKIYIMKTKMQNNIYTHLTTLNE